MFLPTGNPLTRAKVVPSLFTKEMDAWVERRCGSLFSDPVEWFLSGRMQDRFGEGWKDWQYPDKDLHVTCDSLRLASKKLEALKDRHGWEAGRHTRSIWLEVTERLHRENIKVTPLHVTRNRKEGLDIEKRIFALAQSLPDTGEEPSQPHSCSGRHNVLKLKLRDKTQILRTVIADEMVEKPRKEMAASKLNQIMGLDTVPATEFRRHGKYLGAWSEFVVGLRDEEQIVDQISLFEVSAFEFLIANRDIHDGNYLISNGEIRVFDHDSAFWGDFSFGIDWPIGHTLPHYYTRRFIKGLLALTPEVVQRQLVDWLTPGEMALVFFNRDVILTDIKRRGWDCVWDNEDQNAFELKNSHP